MIYIFTKVCKVVLFQLRIYHWYFFANMHVKTLSTVVRKTNQIKHLINFYSRFWNSTDIEHNFISIKEISKLNVLRFDYLITTSRNVENCVSLEADILIALMQ